MTQKHVLSWLLVRIGAVGFMWGILVGQGSATPLHEEDNLSWGRAEMTHTTTMEFAPATQDQTEPRSCHLTLYNGTPNEMIFQSAEIEHGEWLPPSAPLNIKPYESRIFFTQSADPQEPLEGEIRFNFGGKDGAVNLKWQVPPSGPNEVTISRPAVVDVQHVFLGQSWASQQMVGALHLSLKSRL
ncbi:MAG: hypothetical protein ACK5O7_01545 [Holosporales bacterium]